MLFSNDKTITPPSGRSLSFPAAHPLCGSQTMFALLKKYFRSFAMQGFFKKTWKQNKLVQLDGLIISSLLRLLLSTLIFCLSQSLVAAQTKTYDGIWNYEILNTESGDYFGKMTLTLEDGAYQGKIKSDEGKDFLLEILKMEGDSMVFFTNAEGFMSTVYGKFDGDEYEGIISNQFSPQMPYLLTAKRDIPFVQEAIKDFNLIDQKTKEAIPYAHIYFQEGGTITNELGSFLVKKRNGDQLQISAIGYEEKTIEVNWLTDNLPINIELVPTTTLLPQINVATKTINPRAIVKAAINRISENYWQRPYNAELFFRYKNFNGEGELGYHSEAILDFYDAIGYKKMGWRKAAKTRFALLKQGRILMGDTGEGILGLGRITHFWEHEPILVTDKPFALSTMDGFDYQLLGVTKMGEEEVYKISFECIKLRDRYTGYGGLKEFEGTLYISKKDYALLRYESYSDMDYGYENKYSKRDFGGAVRIVHRTHKVEIFEKKNGKYAFLYAKSSAAHETHKLALGEVIKGYSEEEIQALSIRTQDVKPLEDNLFNTKNRVEYDPVFWAKFNIIEDLSGGK